MSHNKDINEDEDDLSGDSKKTKKTKKNKYVIPSNQYQYIIYKENLNAESILAYLQTFSDYINCKSIDSIRVIKSQIFFYISLVLFLTFLFFIIKPIINNYQKILNFIRIKNIWFFFSIVFYIVSISGVIYMILRNPPFYNFKNRKIEIFAPVSNNQYVLEGFIISFCNLLCSLSVVLLSLFYSKNYSNDTSSIFYINTSSKFYLNFKVFLIVFLLFVCIYSFNTVVYYYTYKNKWYS